MALTEEQMEKIRSGSIAAFEVLFNQYYRQVRAFAFGFLKNELEADDAAQLVFTKLWMNRFRLTSVKSLDSYIFTIARNVVTDMFRDRYHFRNFYCKIASQNRVESYEIDNDYDIKDIRGIVNDTITSMPEQRRRVFIMSRRQLMTNDEIAEELGISKRTVEKHISLALAELRSRLGEFLTCMSFILSLLTDKF